MRFDRDTIRQLLWAGVYIKNAGPDGWTGEPEACADEANAAVAEFDKNFSRKPVDKKKRRA